MRQFPVGGAAWPDRGVENRVGTAFGARHQPCLGNADCSRRLDTGRPMCSALAGVSGRSTQVPCATLLLTTDRIPRSGAGNTSVDNPTDTTSDNRPARPHRETMHSLTER